MVRASTQQTVDRIVGTAAVIGLSLALLRWLSSNNNDNMLLEDDKQREEEGSKLRKSKYSWIMPWWWPIIAIDRWNKKKMYRRVGKQTDDAEEEDCSKVKNDRLQVQTVGIGDGEYEHRGSCQCGSIAFMLKGPKHLKAVDSPGKIRYPHIPTSANRFNLLRGESDMQFYYEEDNHDDSSSITFEHVGENDATSEAKGAHVFCGNCGVHVFHADRVTGELEVNANCLDGGAEDNADERKKFTGPLSITMKPQQGKSMTPRSQSSLSSTLEFDNTRNTTIETVSETEPYLGSARIDDSSSVRGGIPRKESITSDPTTQSESYSTGIIAENDDLSMGSSSVTGASMPMYHSSLSVASSNHDRTDRVGLPPLPPPRSSSGDRSVKTLPAFFGDRPGYRSGGARRGGVGSSWSVTSMESTDLDAADAGKSTISPTMRDQMKKYMSRHMAQNAK